LIAVCCSGVNATCAPTLEADIIKEAAQASIMLENLLFTILQILKSLNS
jgi:hypothetical protein